MYSIMRNVCPLARANSTSAGISVSFTPRRITAFSLICVKPASAAAATPSRTLSRGSALPDIRVNVSGVSESSETVIRFSPAARSGSASLASSEPFVVRAMSSGSPPSTSLASSARKSATSRSRSRRTSGSPPVMRSVRAPSATSSRATTAISSKVSNSARGRKAKFGPNTSAGMQ
jgi:hypothetical protein